MQLRLDEVSLAVVLSVNQTGTHRAGRLRHCVEAEEHKSASNGAQAKYTWFDFSGRHSGPISCPRACVIAAQRAMLKLEKGESERGEGGNSSATGRKWH